MRRSVVLGVGLLSVLLVAGVAAAKLRSTGVTTATATFSAAKERVSVRTCRGGGDEFVIGRGTYAGTATFADPNGDLSGPVRIFAASVFNKTDGVGWLEGWIRVRDDDRRAHGRFAATLGPGGALEGFVDGGVNRRFARLLGGVSAVFGAETGFADGKIGNGSTTLPAVLAGRPCGDEKPQIAVRLIVRGEVDSVDAGSIVVKPRDGSAAQTCKVRDGISPSTAKVKKGDMVEVRCGLVDGELTLLKLKKLRSDDD